MSHHTTRPPGIAARAAAARLGQAGRQLALRVELAAAVGPLSALRWRRHMTAKASPSPAGRRELYAELWRQAAATVGATWNDVGRGFQELGRDGVTITVRDNLVPLDDPVTLQIVGDKPESYRRLTSAGLTMPRQRTLDWRDRDTARSFLRDHGRVVVKPATATGRGTGVTCAIDHPDALDQAMLRAAGWATQIVLEEHADGIEHRLLVLDGETIGVVRRRPPHVVGDGRRRIGDLIEEENGRRAVARGRLGLWPIRIDLDCVLTLESQGLSLTSVPAPGLRVDVKSAVNENGATDNETVAPVADHFTQVGRVAARALGARLISVEVKIPDVEPGDDVDPDDVTLIEANTTPGLLYHAQVAEPATAAPVAARILELLLAEGGRR